MKWFKCPTLKNKIFVEVIKEFGTKTHYERGSYACIKIIEVLEESINNGVTELTAEHIKRYGNVRINYAEKLLPYANRLLDEMLGFSKATGAKNAHVEPTVREKRTVQPPVSSKMEHTQDVAENAITQKHKQNGSRLPEDWKPSSELLEWANTKQQERRITLNIPDVIIHFCNYWHAKTGADATKKNWDKTFQNWILNQFNYSKRQPERPPANAPKDYSNNKIFIQRPIEEVEAEYAEYQRNLANV